jgi:type VI secretion system protein VasG
MANKQAATLYAKLAPMPFHALERAVDVAERRRHGFVELSHWIQAMLQETASDLHLIFDRFDVEPSRLERDLSRTLERLPGGAGGAPTFSAQLRKAVEQGWFAATILFDDDRIRFGHLLAGVLRDADLAPTLAGISPELEKIRLERLLDEFAAITAGSPEAVDRGRAAVAVDEGRPASPAMQRGGALAKFCVDVTADARAGKIDPIVGRDVEIRRCIDVLMRRRQNNPILTGEAGVGKTAVVEGLAQRIAAGDVPPSFTGVRLLSLDLGLLQAGAGAKGEFEQRLRNVIDEVQSAPEPIVLFIDEAHTLMGAGGQAGTGDAANLLKPPLARGTLRTIAATTWSEYKKHIEKDPALTRRFQVVQVDEPDEDTCIRMMRKLALNLEKHHRVQLLDEAIEAAVRWSHRYITARQLPDKAVSVLDTACARVAVSQHERPAALEQAVRRLEALEVERAIIEREAELGIDVAERLARVHAETTTVEAERATLEARYGEEKEAVDRVLALRARVRAAGDAAAAAPSAAERDAAKAELAEAQTALAERQGGTPMILASVDQKAVAQVVADWTGIPVGRMVKDEIESLLHLEDELKRRVIGQDHALEAIAKRVRTARAGLDNPAKPIGVFMLCGPSGVGKTETALTLAETLYGGEQNLITINMSEFQEAHTVSSLKGSPPGYVGYGEGGVLTEAVRRKPYSVVLLDEIEKAHGDVHELFFQVFDKGVMEDGEGRRIDFKNTLILLTSNVGSELVTNMCADPDLMPDVEGLAEALRPELLQSFPAALLGRLVVVPYLPLDAARLDAVIRLQLDRIATRLAGARRVRFGYDDAVVDLIRRRGSELESGARMIDNILTNTLLPHISREVLLRQRDEVPVREVRVGVADDAFTYEVA